MTITTSFLPLYQQVYNALKTRLVQGYWKPSDFLPSEQMLAQELGVSQGTVRKALNTMVREKLLERQQGKGTFVTEHTQESSLFRFFRFRESQGESLIPETKVISINRRKSVASERKNLSLNTPSNVVELVRVRSLKGNPIILEKIIQPLSVFPDIDKQATLPNSLYTLYQEKYGISIVRVADEICAVNLPAEYAVFLNLPANSAVLSIKRRSFSMDERIVECSHSYCSTEHFVYTANIE